MRLESCQALTVRQRLIACKLDQIAGKLTGKPVSLSNLGHRRHFIAERVSETATLLEIAETICATDWTIGKNASGYRLAVGAVVQVERGQRSAIKTEASAAETSPLFQERVPQKRLSLSLANILQASERFHLQ